MVNYPIKFDSESSVNRDEEVWETESEEGLKVEMTAPKEFSGNSSKPSPETLFCASLDSCVAATFKAIAERKELDYERVETSTEAVLERGEDSRPMIGSAEIEVKVQGAQDKQKAESIAKATEKNCFIHHSIKTEVEMSFDID